MSDKSDLWDPIGTTPVCFDKAYLTTVHGMVKCLELTFNLVGFICIQSTPYNIGGTWFTSVSMLGFWITALLLASYVFHIVEKYRELPWLKFEFIYCIIMAVLNLLAACFAIRFDKVDGYTFAGVFGFLAKITYEYDACLKFWAIKNREPAQGEKSVGDHTILTTP